MNLTPIEDLIEEDFGAVGTPERDQFEMECDVFVIGELLKDERLKAGLTQEQLAERIGTKKSFISRVERGQANTPDTECTITTRDAFCGFRYAAWRTQPLMTARRMTSALTNKIIRPYTMP